MCEKKKTLWYAGFLNKFAQTLKELKMVAFVGGVSACVLLGY